MNVYDNVVGKSVNDARAWTVKSFD